MAVFAPIPSARVSTAVIVNPGRSPTSERRTGCLARYSSVPQHTTVTLPGPFPFREGCHPVDLREYLFHADGIEITANDADPLAARTPDRGVSRSEESNHRDSHSRCEMRDPRVVPDVETR